MYGVPKDLDLSHYKGRQINQVCFGPCDIQVVCESWIIQIESSFEYVRNGIVHKGSAEMREGREHLLDAVGQDIKDARVLDEHKIIFHLSNGDTLIAIEDTPKYECILLRGPNSLTII